MSQPLLEVKNVYVEYSGRLVLRDIQFSIAAGEFISVVGPSGCGKSTLLSLLAGLTKPNRGEVLFHGQRVTSPSRQRAVIFQNHALFPWLTARENVIFALPPDTDPHRAEFFLEQVGLTEHADFYPGQLSGGMQQRVGIARALAADPEVLLLDEPFASLDLIHRQILSQELLKLARKFNKALVFVTHNVDEALHLGDRIFLMSTRPGRITRELNFTGDKPERILDFRVQDEYLQMERSVHEHLYQNSL